MNPLENDKELLEIIEQAKRLRERCLAYNKRRGWNIDSVDLYTYDYASLPVRISVENMPKDGVKPVISKDHKHYNLLIGDVELHETV